MYLVEACLRKTNSEKKINEEIHKIDRSESLKHFTTRFYSKIKEIYYTNIFAVCLIYIVVYRQTSLVDLLEFAMLIQFPIEKIP